VGKNIQTKSELNPTDKHLNFYIYMTNLPGAVMLGTAYDGGGALPSSCNLLQWAVGFQQQQQQQHRLFAKKAEFTAYHD